MISKVYNFQNILFMLDPYFFLGVPVIVSTTSVVSCVKIAAGCVQKILNYFLFINCELTFPYNEILFLRFIFEILLPFLRYLD